MTAETAASSAQRNSSKPSDLVGRPPAFSFRDGVLHCDEVPVPKLAVEYGTPLYAYSGSLIRERFRAFDTAFDGFPHTICYSVKANPNLSILKLLADLGSGFDIVSGGELERILRVASGAASRVVFSGVGKTAAEMDIALRASILMFNVESEGEVAVLADRAAQLQKRARVALRVNPDVFAETHPYISTGLHKHKFGVPISAARKLYKQIASCKSLQAAGISVHIGSQITSIDPFHAALERVSKLVRNLRKDGHDIRYIDAGGGLGINYQKPALAEFPSRAKAYAAALTKAVEGLEIHLLLEPGRAIVGPAGALITRTLYLKQNGDKRFAIVDAAMNDLIRPSLYSAHHDIVPVKHNRGRQLTFDIVGPICETGDFFARDRKLPVIAQGDLLAILDAGAYGMSISSNYNSRGRSAEVLVDGNKVRLIRRRESIDDQVRNESEPAQS